MNITGYFNDFLASIRLTQSQRNDLITGHRTLRARLMADSELSGMIISTFLQGSYRRSTAVRPSGEKRADVDVIVVTNLDQHKVSPEDVIEKFKPFLEKHYKGKYRIQGRSIGIELSYVDLDVVVTSAPSEVEQELYKSRSIQSELVLEDFNPGWQWRMTNGWTEPLMDRSGQPIPLQERIKQSPEWQLEPLWIPDRDAQKWVQTHPLAQIQFSREKNANTNGAYVNVVKAIKWWKLVKHSELKHPKGYPIEHMVGDCCPDEISTVREGLVKTLEKFVDTYQYNRAVQTVPVFQDRGVQDHDVWKRISVEDFNAFYDAMKEAATKARAAFEATTVREQVILWRELLGNKFPEPPKDEKSDRNNGEETGGFSERTTPSVISGGRFA